MDGVEGTFDLELEEGLERAACISNGQWSLSGVYFQFHHPIPTDDATNLSSITIDTVLFRA